MAVLLLQNSVTIENISFYKKMKLLVLELNENIFKDVWFLAEKVSSLHSHRLPISFREYGE